MGLLIQLGVNETFTYQLIMFLITFVVLKYVLFGPYYAAFHERQKRTEGQTELAERFIAEAHELEQKYAVRAREVNDKYREAYDKSRTEAMHEYDRVVSEAREKTKHVIDENRTRIQKEMGAARTQLTQETASVAQLINNKLIGKDLSA